MAKLSKCITSPREHSSIFVKCNSLGVESELTDLTVNELSFFHEYSLRLLELTEVTFSPNEDFSSLGQSC